ncbi:MAG: hypothetical protein JNK50_02975 [Bacteroidia bacterium]|nr:hypothetical protein [Bacteroidia bacterium]
MSLKPYSAILIASGVSILLSAAINMLPFSAIVSTTWWISILFHVAISLLLNLIMLKKTEEARDMINKIMFTSMGRLLVCMVGVFIYSLVDKPHFFAFAIHFMLHYMVYTVFEITFIVKFIRSQQTKP